MVSKNVNWEFATRRTYFFSVLLLPPTNSLTLQASPTSVQLRGQQQINVVYYYYYVRALLFMSWHSSRFRKIRIPGQTTTSPPPSKVKVRLFYVT
mmetsp:Transcript_23422/g.37644  ORF Transcript_23422/g.37644 Transcript_23422/m.37644 type:complete len:95 (-) Transcript_23422:1417-1701(-)